MSDSPNLYTKLIEYSRSEAYPFHMPGHKRQVMSMEDPYRFDLTEIDGFDNLHEAADVLKEEQERTAALYGSQESHFMVNGSTGGILSAIAGCLRRGDRVLVARNCHTSVYHGLELNGLCPVYLWPRMDRGPGIYQGLTREQAERAFEKYPDIRAVIFTSPTYEGILSDVKGICEAAHRRGIPCIVDEAHGAHLRWTGLPDGVSCGADVVIQSLHKTMPALTQTALIHINGELVNRERIRRMLAVYQTSSPSYILMASISQCMTWLGQEGAERFDCFKRRVEVFRKRMAHMKHLYLYEPEGIFDTGKLVICVDKTRSAVKAGKADKIDFTGRELYDRLRQEFGLQMEMASARYVLAMATVGDSPEGLERLAKSLERIDAGLDGPAVGEKRPENSANEDLVSQLTAPEMPKQRMTPAEALNQPTIEVPLTGAGGCVMGDYLYLYPPGVPILVPGEVIQMKQIEQIEDYLRQGLEVHGGYSKEEGNVKVILRHG